MTETRNKLPVAVNVVAGGTTSKRTGGVVTALDGVGSGPLALGANTGFRIAANMRGSVDSLLILVGYTNPAAPANAEYVLTDGVEVRESVPADTTLYFRILDVTTLEPAVGSAGDYLILTKYL